MLYSILLWLSRAISALPLTTIRAIGRGVANILYPFAKRERRIVEAHQRYLPELAITHRAVSEQLGQALLEQAPLTHWEVDKILNSINIDQTHHRILTEAINQQHGVLMLMPHLGCWEWMGPYLGTHFGVTAMVKPVRNASLNRLIKRQRERFGTHTVPTDLNGVKQLIRGLKQGGIVNMMPDQTPHPESAHQVSFLGKPCICISLPARLIKATQCQVLVGIALRTPTGVTLEFTPCPAEHWRTLDDNAITENINQIIGEKITQHADQYIWNYRRFRNNGEPVYGERT
ncbi:MAG: hypothetical protein HWE20_16035 [Gammaproteobacteria bacterium]|nr:hypothetical protein [Gammaproteobacteria bacterium]